MSTLDLNDVKVAAIEEVSAVLPVAEANAVALDICHAETPLEVASIVVTVIPQG